MFRGSFLNYHDVMLRSLAVAAALLVATSSFAEAPHEEWRTVETPHYRVHYPVAYETWSLSAASRLESIGDAVAREVGYRPQEKIDILVENPIAQSNGLAWPFLGWPRVVFYPEPPDADEALGEHGNWTDLLAVHELAHISHLSRPSRNGMRALLAEILPLGPVTLYAPRWVIEGYATVVEGRLTGGGRPSSSMRAAILRKWAEAGRLPSYAQLNSDQRFMGMSMAYLAGSAYLEWLEARGGEGSLRKVWARLTARQSRDFDAAFAGVYGESPQVLYGRFAAELTASAVAIRREAGLREGALWQETLGATGDPAVSPDGHVIALVVREREKPARLVVLYAGQPSEEEAKFAHRVEKILKADPDDVAPVRTKPLPREPIYQLVLPDGGNLDSPRWLQDGTVLFTHRHPDVDGVLHNDLFAYHLIERTVRQVTRFADIRSADPLPDGRIAIGVRSRGGMTQLVRIDLANGAITAMTDASLDDGYSAPRVSADGKRIVYAAHRSGHWGLFVRDLASGEERTLPIAETENAATPEWSRTEPGVVIASVSGRGFIDLRRFGANGEVDAITRTLGAAISPASSPDGTLYFMSLEPEGYRIRALAAEAQSPLPAARTFPVEFAPALPAREPRQVSFAEEPVASPREYGLGRQEFEWLAGATFGRDVQALEAGARVGDLVGRIDTLLVGSFARKQGTQGAALATSYRGLPVALGAHLYTAEDRHERTNGLEVTASRTSRYALFDWSAEAGGHLARLEGEGRNFGFAGAGLHTWRRVGRSRLLASARGDAAAGDVSLFRGSVRGGSRTPVVATGVEFEFGRASASSVPFVLGGPRSSILPESSYLTRIDVPALPPGILQGDRYQRLRVDAALPALPVTWFWEQHKMWNSAADERPRVRVAGLEYTIESASLPLLRIPALQFRAGAARVLEGALKDRNSLWLNMRWKP